MKRSIVAAAAVAAMLVAVPQGSFAGEDKAEAKAKTKTVALQSKVSKSGYASPGNALSEAAKSTKPYSKIIVKFAKQYGVPVDLAHAVVEVESNFNPKARGRAGEVGLMQIKPATARMMGYKGSVKNLYHPETNIEFGMKYLAAAHELGGGETCGTILKYNAGHGAKRMNPVSKQYCGKVQALLASS
ncbi:transglycosylase SLT domain-containing protein [Neorhizobium sp. T786]|uniref:lytic transglycosylase domain-containing protein n=1 Tax=Pseudorhizobium xiangyangii TaxID=2883104 RepID=UPI001CFF92D9|nr:transglycosylase SLT domain-containing protein [Neorhizobium xiangyangii]MCB5201114.1 transglycosylase SLT domain-containing protein [Neorhizobium xiangyangii]